MNEKDFWDDNELQTSRNLRKEIASLRQRIGWLEAALTDAIHEFEVYEMPHTANLYRLRLKGGQE
jgi:hypothetical protein